MPEQTFSKQSLVAKLQSIRERGWIRLERNTKNTGAPGNTLEDLLSIQENNLPLPNAAEWELKTQRLNTRSLLTLFHMEPSPRALKLAAWLVKNFGWPHQNAGSRYPANEKSFRQTLFYGSRSPRGFGLQLDFKNKKISVDFDFNAITPEYADWKKVLKKSGREALDATHTPYWGFNDVFHKAGIKLKNCFLVMVDEMCEGDKYFIRYDKIIMLSDFNMDGLIQAIKQRHVCIDFDIRTGHNHGTKFRIKADKLSTLYAQTSLF